MHGGGLPGDRKFPLSKNLKCEAIVQKSFFLQCVSDVLINLPNSVDAFYTISWLDVVIVMEKKDSVLHNINISM